MTKPLSPPKLETRTCDRKGCSRKFKVKRGSSRKYCCDECRQIVAREARKDAEEQARNKRMNTFFEAQAREGNKLAGKWTDPQFCPFGREDAA